MMMIRAIRNQLGSYYTSNSAVEASKLGINPDLVYTLEEQGVTHLFPIQRLVFRPATEGRDIIGIAKRGAGKSLAFGIPIIERIMDEGILSPKMPRALALAPTKEAVDSLYVQLHYSSRVRVMSASGDISIKNNVEDLRYGTDILVGTPSRIHELLDIGILRLNEVKYLVLDEADQFSSLEKEVNDIVQKCPLQRQNFIFAAKKSIWIRHNFLNNPMIIDLVGDDQKLLGDGITYLSILVPRETKEKAPFVARLIRTYPSERGGAAECYCQHALSRMS